MAVALGYFSAMNCFAAATAFAPRSSCPAQVMRLCVSGASPARPGQGAANASYSRRCTGVVYGGFDTRDLKEAKALLEQLTT